MNRIFKYPLSDMNPMQLEMPAGAKILALQVQRGVPCIWASVDPDAKMVKRGFVIYGTGHPMLNEKFTEYVGTFQVHDGSLVFHLFTDGKEYADEASEA